MLKDIPGYEGRYAITKDGRVFSRLSNKWIKTWVNVNGYIDCSLSLNGKSRNKRVHRLVALTYLSNPSNHPIINHKNSDRTDNNVENLEWCTYEYNAQEAVARGTHQAFKNRVVTPELRQTIFDMLNKGVKQSIIARILGIDAMTVHDVRKGKWYKNPIIDII